MTKYRHPGRLMLAVLILLTGATLLLAACGGATETTAPAASSVGQNGGVVCKGLVDYPMTLTVVDIDYMEWIAVTADDPVLGTAEYEGVRLSDIFSYVGVQADAKTLVITGSDGSTVELPLASIDGAEAMISVAEDNTLNAVMPSLESEAWVKDVVSMEFR